MSWVMRIAHNLVIDHFRKNNRIPKFESSYDFDIFSVLSDSSLNAEKSLIKSQIINDVKKLIEELPCDQKNVLKYIFHDKTFYPLMILYIKYTKPNNQPRSKISWPPVHVRTLKTPPVISSE